MTKRLDRAYQIELIDKDDAVCAVVEKTIHFKKIVIDNKYLIISLLS